MRPAIRYEVIDWADDVHVVTVRLYGVDHRGRNVDETVSLPGLATIDEVATMVAKMNNGHYRPRGR